MEGNNDGSPPRPEGPKTSPEPSKPTSPEHELTSSSTSSPPPKPPGPTSPEHKLNYSSTSSPSSEPPIPASPKSELASSSTSSPPPEPSGHTPPPSELASSSNTAPPDGCDQNKWVISIKERLDHSQLDKEVWSRYSIFRAPSNLRKMKPETYTPQFISIGPFHRGDPNLRLMESHKWRFLRRSLDRTGQDLDVYIETISPHVAETRGCYAQIFDRMSNQQFLEMMLLDSCFILELLIAVAQGHSRREDDPLFAVRAIILEIRRDMLLLENQIPFFILEKLLPLTAGSYFKDYSLSRLALFFFNWTVPGNITKQRAYDRGNEKVLHFLHLIRQSLITLQNMRPPPPPPPLPPPPSSSTSKRLSKFIDTYEHKHLTMRCVSMLVDSGVKFRKRELSRLTNIEFDFKRGILKIPPLVVDDSTKSIFLNLMAFEQCYPKCSDEISSYVVFMDGLINTPGDVAHLQQKGIINYQLGSEKAVAQLFNDLCRDISIDYMYGSHVFALCSKLNKYVSLNCPSWKASLRREHFRHPWSIISFGAAVFIIGLTLTQAVYAILAYHVHHS